MIQYSFVWYLSPVVFTGDPIRGNLRSAWGGEFSIALTEKQYLQGVLYHGYSDGRKRLTMGKAKKAKLVRPGSPERLLRAAEERAAENEYQMTEEDFIETMRRALSVPPMPRKAGKKVRVVGE